MAGGSSPDNPERAGLDVSRARADSVEVAQRLIELARGADDETRSRVIRAFLPEDQGVRDNLLLALLRELDHWPDFESWERRGVHLTPAHFYSPIPTLGEIDDRVWSRESDLVGLEINDAEQVRLLTEVFPPFAAECAEELGGVAASSEDFAFGNGMYDGTDATCLYCMIRWRRPARVLEVGSGFSSRVIAKALLRNGRGDLICVDPCPTEYTRKGFPGLSSLITEGVQRVAIEEFLALGPDDVLFIDSSHVARIDGDVNFLFLEVLPRLTPGVAVHLHDIFLPGEYPREWVMNEHRFWNEQYLLQAFLTFNSAFEVLLANNYLGRHHHDLLKATFPMSPWWGGASFWIRRVAGGEISDRFLRELAYEPKGDLSEEEEEEEEGGDD
jgi:predicted O-methyltransferase YrrM